MTARSDDPIRYHAIRTAAWATVVAAGLLLGVAVSVDVIVEHNLVAAIDQRLATALAHPPREALGGAGHLADDDRDYEAPVFGWLSSPGGYVAYGAAGPSLPAGTTVTSGPATVQIGDTGFRLASTTLPTGRFVAAVSLASVVRTTRNLVIAEATTAPLVLLAVFASALAIGRRVARPIEMARRRQLDFTADASHELRTPLSVIQAETSLVLQEGGGATDAAGYRTALERISGEADRMRRLVEDLLWLARADGAPPRPMAAPVDVSVIATAAAERFATLASGRTIHIDRDLACDPPPIITAPAEWVDRLIGVLVDNACRYSPDGGRVGIALRTDAREVILTVDDDGPGIPADERDRIFDRFHRATDKAGGAGLGLAIADRVVRATGGRWSVQSSEGGGARFGVTWPRSPHQATG